MGKLIPKLIPGPIRRPTQWSALKQAFGIKPGKRLMPTLALSKQHVPPTPQVHRSRYRVRASGRRVASIRSVVVSSVISSVIALMSASMPPLVMAATPLDNPGEHAAPLAPPTAPQRVDEVARIVRGIVNFTQWPNKPNTIRLCVAQPATYADALTQAPLALGNRTLQPRSYRLDDPHLLSDCDAIYVEISDTNAVATLLQRVTGKPVLTITGSEEGCDMGSLFCLTSTPGALSFAANLDGIARSTLLVNPKVLLLARSAGSAK